jgi:hypothetical protein
VLRGWPRLPGPRRGVRVLTLDGPADPFPFEPDDPRLSGVPLARDLLEAAELAKAFANAGSLASLIEMLNTAPVRDVELAAMFLLTIHVRAKHEGGAEEAGLTREETEARYERWLCDPPPGEVGRGSLEGDPGTP